LTYHETTLRIRITLMQILLNTLMRIWIRIWLVTLMRSESGSRFPK
jgi:hypothetical protein